MSKLNVRGINITRLFSVHSSDDDFIDDDESEMSVDQSFRADGTVSVYLLLYCTLSYRYCAGMVRYRLVGPTVS